MRLMLLPHAGPGMLLGGFLAGALDPKADFAGATTQFRAALATLHEHEEQAGRLGNTQCWGVS